MLVEQGQLNLAMPMVMLFEKKLYYLFIEVLLNKNYLEYIKSIEALSR